MEGSRRSSEPGLEPGPGVESPGDFALRVLLSESLDEKLRPARPVFAPACGEALDPARLPRLLEPGRPASLRFAPSAAARPPLPTIPSLVDDESRGALLHFFANHELLAAELMALALLKFPQAPRAFRAGLAATLCEEQRHTRWYIERMKECGTEFGQFPVNRFFWDAVSGMESPLDYVARLSLTFEQANLDYARHYAGVLAEAGDSRSAAILRRIYRDEIAHVGYGLRWLRRWKEPGESDWDAHRKRLPHPLSPSRAKGGKAAFNAAGRREAGFDEDYIRRLAVFERSRGRTPDVHYFNPEAEARAAGASPGPGHPASAAARDLEILAAFLARRDDVLLMRRPPSREHLEGLRDAGLALPEIVALDEGGRIPPGDLLLERRIHAIRPWAKAPDLPALFAPLAGNAAPGESPPSWTPDDVRLFSKAAQARALPRWFAASRPCRDRGDFEDAFRSLHEDGWGGAVVKPSLSAAGRGMLRIPLEGAPFPPPFPGAHGEEFVVEPAHERIFDFSVQYQAERGRLRLLGFVRQAVSAAGGYRGSLSPAKFCRGLPAETARFLMTRALPLYEVDGEFAADLHAWLRSLDYEGPVGVDSYLWREPGGATVHRPLCEVNARATMGRVAFELRRRVAPGLDLALELVPAGRLRPPPAPPLLDGAGRLCGGSLVLNEIREDTRFAAKITVARNGQEILPFQGS